MAAVIGATVVSEEKGMKFESLELDILGKANKVISTKETTTVVGGKGSKNDIAKRVSQLKVQRDQSDSKYDKEKIDERIAKLFGGVAVLKVGAATETEMKYLKLKIEDAVNATKAAIEEGIVPGGGSALVKVANKLAGKKISGSAEEKVGYEIVVKALEAPLRQIVMNAGKDDGSVVIERVKSEDFDGYNAITDEMVKDMVKAGIVDPVKVTRSAVQNAASAAAILLTTEVAIADEPKKEETAQEQGGIPGGMPGMM
jgi:chaperonin GroEL